MDECQGATINDSAGTGLAGTLTGATAGTCTTSGAWFNGVLRGTSTTGADVPATTDTNNLTIGNNPGTTTSFDGQIDDFRIYPYELTAAQVKNLMGEGAVRFGPTTGAP